MAKDFYLIKDPVSSKIFRMPKRRMTPSANPDNLTSSPTWEHASSQDNFSAASGSLSDSTIPSPISFELTKPEDLANVVSSMSNKDFQNMDMHDLQDLAERKCQSEDTSEENSTFGCDDSDERNTTTECSSVLSTEVSSTTSNDKKVPPTQYKGLMVLESPFEPCTQTPASEDDALVYPEVYNLASHIRRLQGLGDQLVLPDDKSETEDNDALGPREIDVIDELLHSNRDRPASNTWIQTEDPQGSDSATTEATAKWVKQQMTDNSDTNTEIGDVLTRPSSKRKRSADDEQGNQEEYNKWCHWHWKRIQREESATEEQLSDCEASYEEGRHAVEVQTTSASIARPTKRQRKSTAKSSDNAARSVLPSQLRGSEPPEDSRANFYASTNTNKDSYACSTGDTPGVVGWPNASTYEWKDGILALRSTLEYCTRKDQSYLLRTKATTVPKERALKMFEDIQRCTNKMQGALIESSTKREVFLDCLMDRLTHLEEVVHYEQIKARNERISLGRSFDFGA